MRDKDLKQKGQSIVLVAAAMVALVLFVALAVDLSNAYYHRRTAQNAADGGALAGASQMATSINKLQNKDDKLIDTAINRFAELNGIQDTDGIPFNDINTNVDGWYVNFVGDRLPDEPRVGAGRVPAGAVGVEVITHIRAPTYFGGIFGLRGLPITARAVSLLREACAEDCVVPVTTHASILFEDEAMKNPRLHECFNIWNENQKEGDEATPGSYGWVNWTWQQSVCAIDGDRDCPFVDQKVNGCDADTLPDNLDPEHCAIDIRVGDWMNSTAGVTNADDVRCWLLYYLGTHDLYCNPRTELEPHSFVIPVYLNTNVPTDTLKLPTCNSMNDPYDPDTGGLHYQVAGFARMQILGFDLSQGQSQEVSAGIVGTDCITLGTDPHNGNRITAEFLEWVSDQDLGESCTDPMGSMYSAPKIFE